MKVKNKAILHLAKRVAALGGRLFVVGGTVRDLLLSKPISDFDVEIYGLSRTQTQKLLAQIFGDKVKSAGKIFPVYKIRIGKYELDVSLPRLETKVAPGHKGFDVKTTPNLALKTALKRRDFTINAMALDPLNGELFDFWNGRQDLKNKILRVTNPQTFAEDPLRVLRAMQLAARFELTTQTKSVAIIKRAVPKIKELSKERVWGEWQKLLLQSNKPSVGLEEGMKYGVFKKIYPQFWPLTRTKQEKIWHPEGDVWTHIKMAADAAVKISDREKLDQNLKIALILSAFCHDLGKATTTTKIKGRIRSPGHAAAGTMPTEDFLRAIGSPQKIKNLVLGLVENHMRPLKLYQKYQSGKTVKNAEVYKLADDLAKFGANIYLLTLLSEADFRGKGKNEHKTFKQGQWLTKKAKMLGCYYQGAQNIVSGKDLIKLGLKSGKKMGKIIALANKLHKQKGMSRKYILKLLEKTKRQLGEKNVILELEKIT